MNKRLPPYGKKLKTLLASGQRPQNNIFIFLGVNAFQKAKAFEVSQFVLALPLGDDPALYTWPVQRCEPLVFDTGGVNVNTIRRFGFILLNSGAAIVRIVLFDGRMIIYQKENNYAPDK